MTNKEIGEMIRVRRLSREMSQEELAKLCGVSPSTISMYEMGRRRPKDAIVEALADAFNVPIWSILYKENEVIPVSEEEGTPKTSEARRVSAGIDRMPPDVRKKMMEYMEMSIFAQYFKDENKED